MKTLFSDKVVAGLKKVPVFVWFLILAAACFFRECHGTIETVGTVADYYNKTITETLGEGAVSLNVTAFTVFSCIFEALLIAGITELIMYVAYSVLVRRFVCAISGKDFTFRLRIVLIIANIISGIFNISAFFWQGANAIIVACTSFTVPALLLFWYYEDFRNRFVPKRSHGKMFAFIALLYVGIAFVVKLIPAIEYTVTASGAETAIETAAVWLDAGIVAVFGLLAYLNYRRLQKISTEPEDNDIFKPKDPVDDTVFKDLGF